MCAVLPRVSVCLTCLFMQTSVFLSAQSFQQASIQMNLLTTQPDFIGLQAFPQVQSSFMVHSKSCVCMSTHRGVASQICHNAKIISLLRSLEKTKDDPMEQ